MPAIPALPCLKGIPSSWAPVLSLWSIPTFRAWSQAFFMSNLKNGLVGPEVWGRMRLSWVVKHQEPEERGRQRGTGSGAGEADLGSPEMFEIRREKKGGFAALSAAGENGHRVGSRKGAVAGHPWPWGFAETQLHGVN